MKSFLRNQAFLVSAIAIAAILLLVAAVYPDSSREESQGVSPAVKSQMDEYSWDELASISSEIARCQSKQEAIACAHRYGLCAADGALNGLQTKSVQLTNGHQVSVVIADVWHDVRSDGGKAGLTFVFSQPVGEHAMNHAFENVEGDDADSVGGWAASDMRTWLNGELLYQLPTDLRSRIASVQKRSASSIDSGDEADEAGHLDGSGADWIVETTDWLWLLSTSELCGSVPVNHSMDVDTTMAAIYAAEGEQYRLFADAGVKAFKPNESLTMASPAVMAADGGANTASSTATSGATDGTMGTDALSTWWLRTKTLEFGDGFWLVGTDGTPLNGLGEDARVVKDPSYAPDELWGPDHARAVVPGFCL